MTDPRDRSEPVSGPVETGGIRSWTARTVGGDEAPEWQVWSWSSGRPGVPLIGILLVLLGIALLIQLVWPGVSFFSLILAALAIAAGVGWLVRGWRIATVPTLVLGAWAVSRLVVELGHVTIPGLQPLLVGGALLVAWAIGPRQQVRRGWAMWCGGILVILGLADVSGALPGGWDLLWPLLLVGLGVLLIARRRPA